MKNDISDDMNQKWLIFCSIIVLQNTSSYLTCVVTMVTYCHKPAPNIRGISGHLWRSILISANGASYAWSSKHQNTCTLYVSSSLWPCFSKWISLTYWNQVGGDWKRVSCHGKITFYSHRCAFCRTISLLSFNGLCCKFDEDSSV